MGDECVVVVMATGSARRAKLQGAPERRPLNEPAPQLLCEPHALRRSALPQFCWLARWKWMVQHFGHSLSQ